ncbi:MAG: type VI secretion system baseplate subunit TssG [Cytophagaceae bacterium]|nr:type VI secretion system baseplate subunit TssG [Gemmatimonadaceae bacterium]
MPDLVSPWRGGCHVVDSAVPTLLKLGVDLGRIVLASAGPGSPPGTILSQRPAAGTPLTAETRVHLSVSGVGLMERIPFPMRDTSDGDFRVDRLVGLLDDPFLKLAHHIRSAGGLLDLHPDDRPGAARWIKDLFGIDHTQWAEERWYDVARLLPALPRIAGRADGPALALRAVFRLPAAPVRLVTGLAPVPTHMRTRLGEQNGRLGIDALVGDGVPAHTAVEVTIGPVDLATWLLHTRAGLTRERRALYQLVLPAHVRNDVQERWIVGDRTRGARLDPWQREVALGVNSYLGKPESRSIP